eukprot:3905977-Pleurochrysis_carterae.AAC.1
MAKSPPEEAGNSSESPRGDDKSTGTANPTPEGVEPLRKSPEEAGDSHGHAATVGAITYARI